MSFEDTYCLGSPRASQMPWSGLSQTSSAQRWGDYSTMQIDPSDDCTFWYTTEYIINTAAADWASRIVSFKFNNCQ